MSSKAIDEAILVIKQAIAAEDKGEKEKALNLYKEGLGLLSSAVKMEKKPEIKTILQDKIVVYLDRAERLSNELQSKKVKSESDGAVEEEEEEDPEVQKMLEALSGSIVSETPNVKWSDVAGLHVAKSLLKEAVLLPIKFPHLFVGKRKPWKGILLYGPPGTGKSFLAKAVATEAGASTFFSVSSSDLVSKYQGESERLVRNLFDLARKKAPAIIFIDEIDSLCGNRSDGENDSARRIKTEFLVQMQGVGKGNEGILVLGATNTPWDLDPAIRRRFEKRIYIPLPDVEARGAMFKIHIGDTPNDIDLSDYEYLAGLTEGFSGSDLSVLVRDALMEPVRFMPEATHFRKVKNDISYTYEACSPGHVDAERIDLMDIESDKLAAPLVTFRDFLRVLGNSKPSVSFKDVQRHSEWTTEFGQEG